MSSTEERNAKDDMAICDKATPGPWYREKTGATCCGCSVEVEIADTGPFGDDDCNVYVERLVTYPLDDADFIATAREALPYWIKRAVRLEKALDRACEFLKVTIFACPPEDNWGIERKGCDWGDCDKCWKKYFLEVSNDA